MSVRTAFHSTISSTAVFGLLICGLQPVMGVERRDAGDDNVRQVELFEAMKNGDIEVKFVPRDAARANLMVENKTKQPLHIQMPDAFAAVPIQAQFGGGMGGMGGGGMGGMGGGGMGGMGGGGMAQGMGGGMGGMGGGGMGGMGGMGGGGMGGGGGFMRIAAEKRHKVALTTVCLEHGKPDPNPKIPYTIIPIEQFTKDPHVIELCTHLGYGRVPQNTAQAAAWHMMDKLSWQELALKNRSESAYTGNTPFFNIGELRAAMALVNYVSKDAPIAQVSLADDYTSAD
ncbi:hypothetical protein EC9_45780 [Rosistilla ulvae]|uniref:Uncharacterized protein n=1 Tax=Rosistilla ulvae TaxID=1930277 RepID=A0A517M671_9BACT|nr:hypothetical protein [Rosistilla ulvae]QDS90370.1 hypothetical protein EC9_45780 [Rosistilla ulvae]